MPGLRGSVHGGPYGTPSVKSVAEDLADAGIYNAREISGVDDHGQRFEGGCEEVFHVFYDANRGEGGVGAAEDAGDLVSRACGEVLET